MNLISTELAALFAGLTMAWGKLVSFFNLIKDFIFPTYTIFGYNNPELINNITAKILKEYKIAEGQKRNFIKPKAYGLDNSTIYPLLEYINDTLIVRHKTKKFNFLVVTRESGVNLTISGFRWNLSLEWLNNLQEIENSYYYVKHISHQPQKAKNDSDEKVALSPSERWTMYKKELLIPVFNDEYNLVYTPLNNKYPTYQVPSVLKPIVEEVAKWLNSRTFYNERNITWKRGYLLHGKPGTGKTSFVRYLAQLHNIPVAVLDIASATTNDELRQLFVRANLASPCIYLIEDIDSVFQGRELVIKNMVSSLSFDALLNELDGASQESGRLLFITTNNIELLDSALIRPGRVDKVIEVPFLDEEGRLGIINKILHGYPSAINEMLQFTELSAAELQERCVAKALEIYESADAQNNN